MTSRAIISNLILAIKCLIVIFVVNYVVWLPLYLNFKPSGSILFSSSSRWVFELIALLLIGIAVWTCVAYSIKRVIVDNKMMLFSVYFLFVIYLAFIFRVKVEVSENTLTLVKIYFSEYVYIIAPLLVNLAMLRPEFLRGRLKNHA